MKDLYKNTIKVYKKLGKKYIQAIEDVKIEELNDFMDVLPRGGRVLDVGCAGGVRA